MRLMQTVFLLIVLMGIGCQKSGHQILVTAHRGASGLAPENTMSSMLKAIDLGADFAELDVQETSDGVLILLHDNTLMRTAGLDANIWEMDYASLKGIDVGKWFDSKYDGEPIPTLESIIDSVRGKMKLNIELKSNGHEKRLVEAVAELVESKGFIPECIVTSFNFSLIDKLRALHKGFKVGYIFSNLPENIDVFTADVDLLSVKYTIVDEEFVKKAHRNHKEVHVYTVNDVEEMKRLIKLGVDSIITNYPNILIEIL